MSSASDTATACFVCGLASTSTCAHCEKASFCGSAHARLHRPSDACLPFRVAVSPVKGRCLVAARDVAPGELVLSDVSAAKGPKCVHVGADDVQRVCVHCFALEAQSCPACGLPACLDCREAAHASECAELLSRLPSDADKGILMSSVTPYRLWKAQREDPDLKQRLSFLMTHEDELREDPDMEKVCLEVVETLCAALSGDAEQRAELWRCVRLLLVNALDCGDGRGRALFPTFAFLNHSCVTNARHVVSSDGASVRVYSQVAIPEGGEIVITYTNLLRPTESRQSLLLRRWFFLCSCARCTDPTELDSFIGGVRCPNCNDDFLLAELSGETELFAWTCARCAKSISGSAVETLVSTLHQRLAEAIDQMSVPAFEHFLKGTAGYLHENHFLRIIAKRYLSQLYDAADADHAPKKLQACADLMRLFDVLDSGLSQSRGMTQIEATKTRLALQRAGGEPASEGEIEAEVKLIKDCLEVETETSLPEKALRSFLLYYGKQ